MYDIPFSTDTKAYGINKSRFHKSEYPNKCHVQDVTNSEKHPKIGEQKDKPKKPEIFNATSSSSIATKISYSKLAEAKSDSPHSLFNLLQPVVKIVPVSFHEVYQGCNDSENFENKIHNSEEFSDLNVQYYCKKKKRKTEQEKLIASLTETELPHVDGAFKRSTTIRYRNLNEDKLFDNLFDSRVGKPKRSSGKKMLCIGDIQPDVDSEAMVKLERNTKFPESVMKTETKPSDLIVDVKDKSENEVETEMKPLENGADGSRTTKEEAKCDSASTKTPIEQKKKRKTEKEKLIENLSEIEKIHVDGAFKRNVTNANFNIGNNNVRSRIDYDYNETDVFSPVRFVGLDEDIESLILEKTASDAT